MCRSSNLESTSSKIQCMLYEFPQNFDLFKSMTKPRAEVKSHYSHNKVSDLES